MPDKEEVLLKELGKKEKIFIALFNAKKQQGSTQSPKATSKASI